MARYIDADKLIEHIKDLPTWWEDEGGVYGHSMKYPEGLFHCEDVINSIENAPTSDVAEVKHGEWDEVHVQHEGYGEIYYNHKECKISPDELYKCPFEHCPRCGAKMNGGDKL